MTKPLKWVWVRRRPKRSHYYWSKWAAARWTGWIGSLSEWHGCGEDIQIEDIEIRDKDDDFFEYQFTADTPDEKDCCKRCYQKVKDAI